MEKYLFALEYLYGKISIRISILKVIYDGFLERNLIIYDGIEKDLFAMQIFLNFF